MSSDPRRFAPLALLALLPVAAFVLTRELIAVPAVLCVLLIAWSLYAMFGPAEAAAPTP